MQGWVTGCWWLTAIPQLFIKFRAGYPQLTVYLVPEDDDWKFAEKGTYGETVVIEKTYGITRAEDLTEQENVRLWLNRDYVALLEKIDLSDLGKAALIYGEIGLPTYGNDTNNLCFMYSDQLGLVKN
jgi:CRISPR-associated endonuclease/helicase Cas3